MPELLGNGAGITSPPCWQFATVHTFKYGQPLVLPMPYNMDTRLLEARAR